MPVKGHGLPTATAPWAAVAPQKATVAPSTVTFPVALISAFPFVSIAALLQAISTSCFASILALLHVIFTSFFVSIDIPLSHVTVTPPSLSIKTLAFSLYIIKVQ